MLANEIRKIIKRKQFWLVFAILFFAVIADFLVTCKCYYGTSLAYVRSAYRCTIINNDIGLITSQCFSTLLPILACLAASDIYYEEYTLGITNFMYTRGQKKKNIRCKLGAVMLVVFALFISMLLLSLFLSLTAFPKQGHYSMNTTYLTLTTPDPTRILSWFEAYHPYWNILLFMLIRSLIATLLAAFSFSISLFHKGNRYIILLSGFIYEVVYSNIVSISANEAVSTDIMGVNTYGSIWAIAAFMIIILSIILVLCRMGESRDTL